MNLFDALGNATLGSIMQEDNGLSALTQQWEGSAGTLQPPVTTQGAITTPTTTTKPEAAAMLQEAALQDTLKGLAAVDPLAADANGWNLPKTGKVNTTGAMQRINARTGESGVTATKDAKGQLTLTNMDSNANNKPSGQMVVGNAPLALSTAVSQLRKAGTYAEGLEIMDSIRGTITAEQTKITNDALAFASNKLGIPAMEANLRQSELADRADPQWYPGIGDSPITASMRTQLQQLRGQANGQAETYLATNVASGVLKNNLTAATEALNSLKQKDARADALTDQSVMRANDKREQQEQNAQDILDSMNPKELSFLKILNPSLANDNKVAFGKAALELTKPTGAAKYAAIKAAAQSDGTELIKLAAENNADATTLLLSRERLLNPNQDDSKTLERIRRIQQFATDPNFDVKSAKAKFGSDKSPEAKEYLAGLRTKKFSTDPKDKSMAHQERLSIAIDLERKQATGNFINSVNSWGATDPAFNAAVTATIQARGNATFDDVITTYVGSSVGMEAQQKLIALNAITRERLSVQTNSIFGRPDESTVLKRISDKAKTIGIGSAVADFFRRNTPSSETLLSSMSPVFGTGIRASRLLSTGSIEIDPTTGKPFAK